MPEDVSRLRHTAHEQKQQQKPRQGEQQKRRQTEQQKQQVEQKQAEQRKQRQAKQQEQNAGWFSVGVPTLGQFLATSSDTQEEEEEEEENERELSSWLPFTYVSKLMPAATAHGALS